MKSLRSGVRVLAPAAILLTVSLGCGRSSPVVAHGSQEQSTARSSAQAASPHVENATGNTQGQGTPNASSVTSTGSGSSNESDLQSPSNAGPAVQQDTITVPSGARLMVRTSQSINVKHAFSGERFAGTLAEPVVVGNSVAIPAGSIARGEVLAARHRGLFKGKSVLALTLTGLNVHGTEYRIETSDLTRTKKGKGRRSAALIGGGAGLGMLVGGVASGGVGLLVGGLAGGGAGTVASAFTGNRDTVIPAEAVLSFRLQNALTLSPTAQQSEAP